MLTDHHLGSQDLQVLGVLGDHLGMEKIHFSKSIGIEDSNVPELLAIREALILYASSVWAQNTALIMESDSKNAVTWVLNPKSAPWRVQKFINHIENVKSRIKEWKLQHIPREYNQIANSLEKGILFVEMSGSILGFCNACFLLLYAGLLSYYAQQL
ncbi:hypothetical protein DITRI_Ditri20bG0015100 [Diplodiscus trichospermus]